MKTENLTLWRACGLLTLSSALAVLLAGTGCSSTHDQSSSQGAHTEASHAGKELYVGVTPDYPPLVFDQDGSLSGAEIDMARALGKELQRPIQFITLKRDDQINALNDGRVDII